MTTTATPERLAELIETERHALISGDLKCMADLAEEKETLFRQFEKEGLDRACLGHLRSGLRRNHELFDEALKGIKAVADRLAEVNQLRVSLDTYDAQGQRTRLKATEHHNVERRA